MGAGPRLLGSALYLLLSAHLHPDQGRHMSVLYLLNAHCLAWGLVHGC